MTTSLVTSPTWTVEDNKRQMQVSDDAYNAKDVGRFNHHDDAKIHMPGGLDMDMDAHMADIIATLAAYPDMTVYNHDYKIAIGEGEWTFAVADVAGTNTGPLRGPGGAWLSPTRRKFRVEMLTAARWVDGLMVEEYVWFDALRQMRQLRLAGAPVELDLPNDQLAITPVTPLHSGQGGSPQENKQRMKAFHDALNAQKLDATDLAFAPDAVVYGAAGTEPPMDVDAFRAYTARLLAAFPDLHVHNDPYRVVVAEGDWTGTLARLTGTHTGILTPPAGSGISAVQGTGKTIDLNYYTIARWQNGTIAELKVMFDWAGTFGQLGLS